MQPSVSIILPSLNVVDYIDECLTSVTNQTLSNIEIICVDAGSSDGTLAIIEHHKFKDSRISLINSDKKSYGYQMNMGIHKASGKYIGIVETDDFVSPEMFEKLYEIARENNLEVLKANYQKYYTFKGSTRIFTTTNVLYGTDLTYSTPISKPDVNKLRNLDENVWSGIYNRDFLLSNNIIFNESSGAAYQDIGFLQQVFSSVNKIMYLNDAYYNYCTDRAGSSSNKPNGLKYAKQEFEFLISFSKSSEISGIYYRMAGVFVGEYNKFLLYQARIGQEVQDDYSDWFIEKLELAIHKGYISKNLEYFSKWDNLLEIITNKKMYSHKYREKSITSLEDKKKLLSDCSGKDVIIFGLGVKGKRLFYDLSTTEATVISFCDNSTNLIGTKFINIPVLSPTDSTAKYPNSVYLVSSTKIYDAVKDQLLKLGISETQIVLADY